VKQARERRISRATIARVSVETGSYGAGSKEEPCVRPSRPAQVPEKLAVPRRSAGSSSLKRRRRRSLQQEEVGTACCGFSETIAAGLKITPTVVLFTILCFIHRPFHGAACGSVAKRATITILVALDLPLCCYICLRKSDSQASHMQ
jgi:hypothetical protein